MISIYLQRHLGGKTGIRTLETLLTFTHFPGVPLQPLEHLSCFFRFAKVRFFFNIQRTFCLPTKIFSSYPL